MLTEQGTLTNFDSFTACLKVASLPCSTDCYANEKTMRREQSLTGNLL